MSCRILEPHIIVAAPVILNPKGQVPPRLVLDAGARPTPPSAAPGDIFIVTAYCPCRKCCGKWADVPMEERTVPSGYNLADLINRGVKFVAAPPPWPLGALVDVPGYGIVRILDRMPERDGNGRVNPYRLDVFYPDHEQALQWGRKTLAITIYAKGNQDGYCN